MNDFSEYEFVIENDIADREYPTLQITGWETVVFHLQDETEIIDLNP